MHTEAVIKTLSVALADTYTLYLKTQNYHWHVVGANFKELHELFEEQYTDLALAVDSLAERIVTLGGRAPATFKDFLALKTIDEGHADVTSEQMLQELVNDQAKVIDSLTNVLKASQEAGDEGTIALMGERLAHHEKVAWMLRATLA